MKRKRKVNIILCTIAAIIVSLSLVILPFADTLETEMNEASTNLLEQTEGAAQENSEVANAAEATEASPGAVEEATGASELTSGDEKGTNTEATTEGETPGATEEITEADTTGSTEATEGDTTGGAEVITGTDTTGSTEVTDGTATTGSTEGTEATTGTEAGTGGETTGSTEATTGTDTTGGNTEATTEAETEESKEDPTGDKAIVNPEDKSREEKADPKADNKKEEEAVDKKPPRSEFTYEDDSILVTAILSDPTAIPADANLFVSPITKESGENEYEMIEAMVSENVEKENKEVTGFLAYDIYFAAADGTKYEPTDGTVAVQIQYKNDVFSEEVKKLSEEIKVLHLEKTDQGVQVSDVTQVVDIADVGETLPSKEILLPDPENPVAIPTDPAVASPTGTPTTPLAETPVPGSTGTPGITPTDSPEPSPTELPTAPPTETPSADPTETPSADPTETPSTDPIEAPSVNPTEAPVMETVSKGMDTVQFITKSFSTFVVTGVTTATTTFKVGLQFLKSDNSVDTNINGTFYLNITGTNGYRYNIPLVVNAGTASKTISGLYDANGNDTKGTYNGSKLYPFAKDTYTAVLYKYPTSRDANYKWDANNPANVPGCVVYNSGSEIADNYVLGTFPGSVTLTAGAGELKLIANARIGTPYSKADLWNALAPVRPYAVFSNRFDLVSDMEGSIAVKNITIQNNFGNSDNNRKYFTYSNYRTIKVNKTYTGSTVKTFTFGLFDSCGTLLNTQTITLPNNGQNTGSISFQVNDCVNCYSVYELGAGNVKLFVGSTYDGFKLTNMTEGSVTTTSSIQNSTSYIETILSTSVPTAMRPGTTTNKNNLVVGNQYGIKKDGSNTNVLSSGTTLMYAPNDTCTIAKAGSTFPIDFTATLQQMSNLSVQLAQALTSDTVMVKYMTIAEWNGKMNSDLNINTNGKMLLINIDATGNSDISLYANAKLVVNGASCGGWTSEVGNVVVNIYTKSGSTYAPYTGSISNAGFVMGTLLAPKARVTSLNQNFNGNIIADYVSNVGAEVHGNTMGGKLESKTYDFINTELAAYVLPATGSIGTGGFYMTGGILLAFAGLLMTVRTLLQNRTIKQGSISNST